MHGNFPIVMSVWASGLCSLERGFRYTGYVGIRVLLHTFYCIFGQVENVVRFIGEFVTKGSVTLVSL